MKTKNITIKDKITAAMVEGVTDTFIIDIKGEAKRVGVSLAAAADSLNSGRISNAATTELSAGVKAIAHPFDRYLLALAGMQETYHRRCLKKIAQATINNWKVKKADGTEPESTIAGQINDFLWNVNGSDDGLSILRALQEDFEAIGDC